MSALDELLQLAESQHQHLCPRQVLGVRMGLLGARQLELDAPRGDRRLLTLVETDGCAADALAVATGCRVGRRTLRVIDFGKVAATFVDTETGRAVRVAPRSDVRARAWAFAPEAESRWHAQLWGYQRMPAAELLKCESVVLTFSLEKLLSRPGYRVMCSVCGEEIANERELYREGTVVCRSCAGQSYYQPAGELLGLRPLNGLEVCVP